MAIVFQYGSNCDANRLNLPSRLSGAAVDRGRAQTIDEYELKFNVWSKGNGCAAGNLVPTRGSGRYAWGVCYEIPEDRIYKKHKHDDLKTLEEIEGKRYEAKIIPVRFYNGEQTTAITFVVKPEETTEGLWTKFEYVSHIIKGLRDHKVPEEYVQHVVNIALETNEKASSMARDESLRLEAISGIQEVDYLRYYNSENYLFSGVTHAFQKRGYLIPEEFFSIVIWKANRAKAKIKGRLLNQNRAGGIAQAVKDLTSAIYRASDDRERVRIFLEDWKLRLPIATAILTVLYPDRFTVYDVRVREQLNIADFAGRKDQIDRYFEDYLIKVSQIWKGGVLRDKDRYLWGKSAYEDLKEFLKESK